MPGGSGTGPRGMGPMTGRAAGYCAGFSMPGYSNMVPGRGFGAGFGRGRGFSGGGRGWRNMFFATGLPGWMRFGRGPSPYYYPASYLKPDPEMEERALRDQANALKAEMEYINNRLGELEAKSKDK